MSGAENTPLPNGGVLTSVARRPTVRTQSMLPTATPITVASPDTPLLTRVSSSEMHDVNEDSATTTGSNSGGNDDDAVVELDLDPSSSNGTLLTFTQVDELIQSSFNDIVNNHSAICDIMALYLKGQKILHTEAKTICEQRLHALMLPAIFITSVCTILSLALKDISFGATIISSLSGANAFILALVSYMKLDAKAEAHRTAAYKFDKMESILVFNSGKMLFVDKAVDTIDTILTTTEKNIREVKEANQFGLPEYVRYNYPHLYSMNVFAEVKKIHYKEQECVNDLKDTLNDITVLKQNENRTPLEETKLAQLRELQRAIVKKIINLKDDYLTIDNQFADELERARNRVHRCPSPCDWLKT